MTSQDQLADLMDAMFALIRIMEEESEALALSGPTGDIAELAQAKLRLAARMDAACATLNRTNADWLDALEGQDRASFAEVSEELHKAATVNSAILERQIDLSTEMLQAVGRELENASGRRGSTYSRLGDLRRLRSAMPLSLNQRY